MWNSFEGIKAATGVEVGGRKWGLSGCEGEEIRKGVKRNGICMMSISLESFRISSKYKVG